MRKRARCPKLLRLSWAGFFAGLALVLGFHTFAAHSLYAMNSNSSLALPTAAECDRLLGGLGETLAGRQEFTHIYDLLRIIGEDGRSRVLPPWLIGLEDTIIEFYEHLPRDKSAASAQVTRGHFESFCQRWGFNPDQGIMVLTVYGMKIFEVHSDISGSTDEIKRFLSNFYFLQFLKSSHPAARHHDFYLKNVGRKSVPEMANELGVSIGVVYRELYLLRISTAEVYRKLREDQAEGRPIPALSPQFLEFVRHHLHEGAPRGESWDRSVSYEGQVYNETQLLAHLHDLDLSHAQIAQILSSPSVVVKGSAVVLRTPSAVRHKLTAIGLTDEVRPLLKPDVFDVNYGYLKINGRLQEQTIWIYLRDHRTDSAHLIINKLNVSFGTLKRFIIRNRIGFMEHASLILPGIGPQSLPSDWDGLVEETSVVESAVKKTLEWLKRNPGQLPGRNTHFLNAPPESDPTRDVVGIRYLEVFGAVTWAEFWIMFKERAIAEGIPFYLHRIKFPNASDEELNVLRPHWQEEALELSVKYMEEDRLHGEELHPRATWPWVSPTVKHRRISFVGVSELTQDGSVIPISWSRMASRPEHGRKAGDEAKSGIFRNTSEYFLALYRYANTPQVAAQRPWLKNLRLLDAPLDSDLVTPEVRETWIQEAVRDALRFTRSQDTFIPAGVPVAEAVNITPGRFFGSGRYAEDGSTHNWRVFDSYAHFYRRFFELDQQEPLEGGQFRVWWISLSEKVFGLYEPGSEMRSVLKAKWKEECLELILDAFIGGQNVMTLLSGPRNDFWRMSIGARNRLLGISPYNTDYGIFTGRRELYETLLAWLRPAAPEQPESMAGNETLLRLHQRLIESVPGARINELIQQLEAGIRRAE